MSLMRTFSAVLIAASIAACGGGGDAPADSAPPASGGAASGGSSSLNFDPANITPAQVALGDSLFHGKIGATSCQACHGVGGKNGAAAPDLTDGNWLHSDGTLEGIFNTIKSGVMAPKEFTGVMPPYGGVQMSDERTLAVASYVYKLAHP